MRDLTEYVCKAMDMLDAIGVQYGNIIDVIVNYRAHRRWGQCSVVPGGYTIEISSVLLDERNDETGLMNTILHELIHSVKGCMNHGAKWKAIAAKVKAAYGYNIKRTSNAAEKGVDEATRPIEYKYIFKCKGCGCTVRRERASKFVQYYQHYHCAVCGGAFERIK